MSALTNGGLESRLKEGLALLGQPADQAQRAALLSYLDMLIKWNGVYNLTSVRDPADMLAVHLLDSLSVVPLIDRYAATSILDVGSGAGLPGIPLAIMRPALIIHSVDAVAKKIGFQLQVKATLKLSSFFPIHQRVEALTLSQSPDLIVSRAYAELAVMLKSFGHVSHQNTRVLAMKGARPDAEIAAVRAPWRVEDVVPIDVPFLGARRCAVLLQRVS
jgi:16S rRNA (guanine527-N7)-methyltransferase